MPCQRSNARVTAVVLAAGLSTRMGGHPKPLLPFGDGTVIDRILNVLSSCPVAQVVVVTGHQRHAVEAQVAAWRVCTAFNPGYASGEMLSSLQVGLDAAGAASDAALVVLGDQPALQAATVRAVLSAYGAGPGSIIIPSFEMRRGHPILIAREHWPPILDLTDGQTLRDHLRRVADQIQHVRVDTPGILRDMDTPEDYSAELAAYARRREMEPAWAD